MSQRRHPDPCPQHPEALIYRSTKRTANWLELVQHHCAHQGCNQQLGWYLLDHGPTERFAHGPGAYRNPDALHAIELAQHREASKYISISLLGLAVTAALVALFTNHHHMTGPTVASGRVHRTARGAGDIHHPRHRRLLPRRHRHRRVRQRAQLGAVQLISLRTERRRSPPQPPEEGLRPHHRLLPHAAHQTRIQSPGSYGVGSNGHHQQGKDAEAAVPTPPATRHRQRRPRAHQRPHRPRHAETQ